MIYAMVNTNCMRFAVSLDESVFESKLHHQYERVFATLRLVA